MISSISTNAACASALNFVEDGKEYIYETEGGVSVGTMDYATHTSGFAMKMKTRMQVSGNTLNIKVRKAQNKHVKT